MTTKYIATAIAVTASLFLATPRLHADDTVNNIRQADPPKVSTGTARSDPKEISKRENAKEQERQKDVSKKYSPDKISVPPPKVDKNNPTGDKDVQKGIDEHQKEYKDKRQSNK
jgi:hypothetical protein